MSDLNNYLFAQIEELQDEDLQGERLKGTIQKSMTIAKLGETIVKNAKLQLDAARFSMEYGQQAPFTVGIEDKTPKKAVAKK